MEIVFLSFLIVFGIYEAITIYCLRDKINNLSKAQCDYETDK